jgi:hypothetical protein
MEKTEKCNQTTPSLAVTVTLALMCLVPAGCDSLRFAPSEAQKQNAWLHNRTALVAAETARAEDTSPKLQALTQLNEVQSRAFSAYCGLPEEFPNAETALQAGAERPDAWQVVDSMLELGIGICALFGGVVGTRAVRFLSDAKGKSQALKEIIAGNELFKKQNASATPAFKQAHQNQSPQTRQLVVQMRA